MTADPLRPAWSAQFAAEALRELTAAGPIAELDRDWAWGGSAGRGVRVAVVDSGLEHDHPALGGAVRGGVVVQYDERAKNKVRIVPDDLPRDMFGHGTACAGIIHALAPEAELYSVRVLGRDLTGRAFQFAGGLRWAIEHGMQVVNLSLSTSRDEYFGLFHQLADEAYFKNVMLVSAVNNLPLP
ncbi:MAG: S8 family serine peptidase, partial [Chloroflexi bacterium]|nr:S8 family serine peptidase [Chloroflexota bacterium]